MCVTIKLTLLKYQHSYDYNCNLTLFSHTAQPTVNLAPKEVTIESDKEKTLSCEVNKFYPNLVDVKWMEISKNNQDGSVAAEDICIGASVENEDGTFNVTSKLRLQPSLQDNGNVYRCIVSHKTFPAKLLLSTTLTVTGIHSL